MIWGAVYSYDDARTLHGIAVLYASERMHLDCFGKLAGEANSLYVEADLPLYDDAAQDTVGPYFDAPGRVRRETAVPSDVFPGWFVLDGEGWVQYLAIAEASGLLPG